MFELDSVTGELRKDGKSWPRIRDQALQILIMLLEKSDKVVGRDELRERLWPSDTFVDFDHGVNAINQVRTALGDSASNPKFIQTLPRRRYRFIGPVQIIARENGVAGGAENRDKIIDGSQQGAAALTGAGAEMRSSILSDHSDLPVIRKESVRILFSLIQLMYLIFYIIFLVRLSFAEAVLNDWGPHAFTLFLFLVVAAAIGIPVRLYLLTAIGFRYQGL
jgi:DNA-binding winged helix-turn-helix (wHTH) protein